MMGNYALDSRDTIYNNLLFTERLINKIGKEKTIKIFANYNDSMSRFLRLSNIDLDNVDELINYCNLLEKYQQYDKFLYNPIFFKEINYKYQELLIKYFNKNIKHLLINSQVLLDESGLSLRDLLKLCNALGVFSDDEKISQKMSTFINERMFNNDDNSIIGYDIHTTFGTIEPRDDIDYEFIVFFVENYEKLIELEECKYKIISRIYNAFRDISKTSTSHKGSQRHLKVTLNKCLNYFIIDRFEGITEENKKLAELLKKYYSEPYVLSIGETIVNQSQNAPRNIFSKVNFTKDGKPIYSYDPNDDLKEDNNYFSYHWLPKQDYDNLLLGKYCSCCSHLLGKGAGIMRASMILNNCQNLVIRNNLNEIIAKMTIYVNKELGYAVFNTAEINHDYLNDENISEIYKAFIRGVNAFVDKYDKNNITPISTISIGECHNNIKNFLGDIEAELLPTPNYSAYGYYIGDKSVGTYNDEDYDSKNKQILILKK